MSISPKSVENVGGEDNADLIFQMAIDDYEEEKDWNKIVEKVGNSVTPKDAKNWFESITAVNKKDRWTKTEEDILRSVIFPKQKMKTEEICNMFKNRSKKAVINKIFKLKKSLKRSMNNGKIENFQHSTFNKFNHNDKSSDS